MASKCSVCGHPELNQINEQLKFNVPYEILAARFELGADSLQRHKGTHVDSLDIKGTQDPQELIVILKNNLSEAEVIAKMSVGKEKIEALREVRQSAEALAKLVGAYRMPDQKHMLPFWQKIKSAILTALKEYPEARASVLIEIERLQAND